MNSTNLKFIATYTVEQFKELMKVNHIDVKENPHTNKLFMVFGAEIGAVSAKGIPTNPMISLVETADGTQFYLLHEEGTGGAPTLASF